MKNVIILTLCSFVLFACTSNQAEELTEQQKTIVKQEVMETYETYISSLNNMDVTEMSAYWNPNELIAINSNFQYFNSYNRYEDVISNWYSNRESQRVKIKQSKAEVLKENLVLITDILNWDVMLKDGTRISIDVHNTFL